jgi:peptidoglycan/xylan/chitin deacetylase (PgdA/CDA1 family)
MRGMILEVAGALLAAGCGTLAYAVGGRSSQLFGPSIAHGPRDRRAIALTFDDGPSERTPELLELLEAQGARATFFQCGASVRRLPEIARRVAAGGHEIGNHAYSHTRLFLRSPRFVAGEVRDAQRAIQDVTGTTPRLFRAPYGGRWFGLRGVQRELGLTGVMWTRIGMDWKWPAARASAWLLSAAENGAIFCLHDGRRGKPDADISTTIEVVRLLLDELRRQGFRCETVSELLGQARM